MKPSAILPSLLRKAGLIPDEFANHYQIIGSGNQLEVGGANIKGTTFDVEGNNNIITIHSSASLRHVRFYVRGSHHQIRIGASCRFNRGGCLWLEDDHGMLEIGPGTTVEDAHLAVTEPGSSLRIGADCMFAYDIDIRTGDSHSILDLATGKRINPARSIVVQDHVWLAAHVTILKGVTVGHDSIVATQTVVTQDVPCNSIVAGAPARVIRTNITWDRERYGDFAVADPPTPCATTPTGNG